jgi:lysozyme family protein
VNFDQAFEKLIGHEGGYQSPEQAVARNDPGGETNWGISKRSYQEIDIAALTINGAKEIYLRDYWKPAGCDLVPDALRFDLFDMAVNSGVRTAIKTMQKAVFTEPDGMLGPHTRMGISLISTDAFLRRFNGFRLFAMTEMGNWPQAGRGWARRIASNLVGAA